jgi:hypothetical protein
MTRPGFEPGPPRCEVGVVLQFVYFLVAKEAGTSFFEEPI